MILGNILNIGSDEFIKEGDDYFKLVYDNNAAHIGSALSIVDILSVLMLSRIFH